MMYYTSNALFVIRKRFIAQIRRFRTKMRLIMTPRKISLFSIAATCCLLMIGCNSSHQTKDSPEKFVHYLCSSEELIPVRFGLFKHQSTNAYYMRFFHIMEKSQIEERLITKFNQFSNHQIKRLHKPEERFIAILNSVGDTLKDLNEREFKYFFNYFVDDNYLFQTTDQHDFYEVYTHSIKDLPPGCYFDGSDYRIHEGRVEFYQNRGVTLCNDRFLNQERILCQNVPNDFAVLDIQGCDCCVINQKIYCSGCLVEGALDEKIQAAINEKRFKKKYCYPIKNERMSK